MDHEGLLPEQGAVASFTFSPVLYAVTVSASPDYAGAVTGGGVYESDEFVAVTATANTGYEFIKWTENGETVSTDESYTFTVSANRELVAVFERETGNLTVQNTVISSIAPDNDTEFAFTVTLSDTTINGTYGDMFFANGVADISLKAGESVTAEGLPANVGYTVTTQNQNGFILTGRVDHEGLLPEQGAVASFTFSPAFYAVTVSASPDDAGAVTGGGVYEKGTEVTVAATANTGYKFVKWTENGTEVSTDEIYTFTVSDNRELVAVFEEKETLTIDETVQNYTYDNTNKAFVITGDFTVTYQQDGQEVTPKNAGTYDVVITRDEDDTYKEFETTITGGLVINKAEPIVSAPTAKIGLIYDGNDKELVHAGETSGGEMQYSLDETTWGTAIPQGNAAGSYTVYYKVVGGNNYNDNAGGSVLVTIGEADMSAGIVAYGYTGDYDNENHTISVALSGAAEGATVKYGTVDGTYDLDSAPVYKDVTTLTVYYQVTKANYATVTGSQTVTINPKEITGADVGTFMAMTYTGSEQIPTATVTIDGLTVTGTWSAVTDVADTTTFTANGNFIGTIADKETGMAQADSSVTTDPNANTLTYNKAAQELVTEGAASGGTLKYSLDNENWADTIPTRTDAGNYEVWYKVFGDANHNDTEAVKVDVTIAKKSIEDATVALDGELTYNGTEQTQNVTVTLDGFTVTFDVADNKATNVKTEENYILKVTGNGNFEGEKMLEWNIAKATPAQNPEKLTTARVRSGQTLANATVTNGEFFALNGTTVLEGTFTWIDDTEAISEDTTKRMKFTPVDTNYAEIEIDVAVDCYITGGGGTTRYTVKFDTDGGSSVASKTVARNSKVTEPTAPTKDGFTFEGWYTDEELTEKYDFDSKVTKNFTLFAKWDKHDDDEPVTPDWKNPFDDVASDDWFYGDVEYAVENGLFNGTTASTFAPNGIITRAMMVTVLYRAEGAPEVAGEATFTDIDENAYYAKAVVWGQQNGIIKGYSETEFAPDQNITREQIAAIIHRYAQYKRIDVSVGENTNILSYDDFDSISEYAIASMQYAVGAGLIKGKTEATLNPLDNATRAEIAAILHRFIEANK